MGNDQDLSSANNIKNKREIPENLTGLIIDEHDFVRKIASKILKKMGFKRIIECNNGKDAKNLLIKSPIDLIISNIEVPYFSGCELLQTVRSLDTRSDIPFLFLTGTDQKDEIVKAADFGANDYVVLPVQAEELEAKIYKALKNYLYPSSYLSKLRRAESLIFLKDYANALLLATEVVDSIESPRASHLVAYIHLLTKDVTGALDLLRSNIEKYPNFLKNYATMANFYLESGNTSGAISMLTEELTRNPKQPLRQITLGNLLLKDQKADQAIKHFRLALIEIPKNPDALYGMGHALAQQGRIEKSIYYFKRYRKHHPFDSKPLKAILKVTGGEEHRRIGEIALRDEVKTHPERPDASYILSEYYVKSKQYESAKEVLEELCKRHSEYLQAYKLLSKIYILQKEPDKAVQLFQELCQRSQNPDCLVGLAGVYLLLGKFSQCIASLNQAISLDAGREKVLGPMLEATYKTKQFGKAFFLREIYRHQLTDNKLQSIGSLEAIDKWMTERAKVRKATLAS